MPLRFFRRIRIAPGVSVNLSKSGASVSVGPRGAKVNRRSAGRPKDSRAPRDRGVLHDDVAARRQDQSCLAARRPTIASQRAGLLGATIPRRQVDDCRPRDHPARSAEPDRDADAKSSRGRARPGGCGNGDAHSVAQRPCRRADCHSDSGRNAGTHTGAHAKSDTEAHAPAYAEADAETKARRGLRQSLGLRLQCGVSDQEPAGGVLLILPVHPDLLVEHERLRRAVRRRRLQPLRWAVGCLLAPPRLCEDALPALSRCPRGERPLGWRA